MKLAYQILQFGLITHNQTDDPLTLIFFILSKIELRIVRLLEIGLGPSYTNFLHFIKTRIQIVRLLEIGLSNIGLITLNIYFQPFKKGL